MQLLPILPAKRRGSLQNYFAPPQLTKLQHPNPRSALAVHADMTFTPIPSNKTCKAKIIILNTWRKPQVLLHKCEPNSETSVQAKPKKSPNL